MGKEALQRFEVRLIDQLPIEYSVPKFRKTLADPIVVRLRNIVGTQCIG